LNVPYKDKAWVTRLPRGLQEQPAWVFIGTLVALAGLSYLLGLSQSSAVAQVLSDNWIRTWGGFLCASGCLVMISTLLANKPLERLSLRLLSLGLFVYMGWVVTAVSWDQATITSAMSIALIGAAEIRVALIKRILRPIPHNVREVDKCRSLNSSPRSVSVVF
jgi:hypothetical protein